MLSNTYNNTRSLGFNYIYGAAPVVQGVVEESHCIGEWGGIQKMISERKRISIF